MSPLGCSVDPKPWPVCLLSYQFNPLLFVLNTSSRKWKSSWILTLSSVSTNHTGFSPTRLFPLHMTPTRSACPRGTYTLSPSYKFSASRTPQGWFFSRMADRTLPRAVLTTRGSLEGLYLRNTWWSLGFKAIVGEIALFLVALGCHLSSTWCSPTEKLVKPFTQRFFLRFYYIGTID